MSGDLHIPVLLDEVLESLAIVPTGIYLDCTFGRGGHSAAILERLGKSGRLFAFDRDAAAAAVAQALAADSRFSFHRLRFSMAAAVIDSAGLGGQINGILMDLGVSSPQLDDAVRGFSFQNDGPLDMRMDAADSVTAAEWLAQASQAELERCLRDYGEERFARRIARRICAQRESTPLVSTAQLAALVASAVPRTGERIHPATRTFQALRIRINDELGELERALPALAGVLAPGGRLCVIAFHSLEDRIVKRYFRDVARPPEWPAPPGPAPYGVLTRKPISPSDTECGRNPRARSARLRVLERAA